MATDGVKILENDLAHDTYSSILGLFENGLDREAVLLQLPFERREYGIDDDYYHELFVTSYALAFWEVGWLNSEIMKEVEKVIAKAASVVVWTNTFGASAGRRRQKVLNEFWSKINSVNSRLRKRRKFKQTEVAFFEVDDLLAYKSSSGMYRVLVCAKVDLYRGKHEYTFVPTSYYGETIPTLEEIRNYGIYGVKIAVSGDRESVSQSQNGVSELWDLFSEETFLIPKNSPFIIGLLGFGRA